MNDMISRTILRELDHPKTHKCPICHSKPGKDCNGFGVHEERVQTARNALLKAVYSA